MSQLDPRTEQQYWAAHKNAAVVDRSDLGRIAMVGRDCLDLLHRLSTQDLLHVQSGQGTRTVLTSDKGRILDVLTVYRMVDRLILLTSPDRQADTLAWLDRYTFSEDSAASDLTPNTGLLAVLGPKAVDVAERAAGQSVAGLEKYEHVESQIAGVPVTIARAHEPLDGLQVLVHDRERLAEVMEALLTVGAPLGVQRIGPAAYEVLRIEAGIGAYGRELGEQYNPLEAQLRDSISFRKGCYIGQEVIARLDSYQKVQKLQMGLLLPPGEVPSTGTKLIAEGKEVGLVTSATVSPALGRPIALAYVAFKAAKAGMSLALETSPESHAAQVVDLPFTEVAAARS